MSFYCDMLEVLNVGKCFHYFAGVTVQNMGCLSRSIFKAEVVLAVGCNAKADNRHKNL
jgi:hypothetical protein